MAIDIVPKKYEMHTILRYLAPISITLGLDEIHLLYVAQNIACKTYKHSKQGSNKVVNSDHLMHAI